MIKVVYPGSFDPISKGHFDIIKRAASLFDEVHVLVSFNIEKKYDFTTEERVEMIKKVTKEFKNVVVYPSNGLVVEYAKENNINAIIRGIRNINDYEQEYRLSQFNKQLNNNIETLIMFPETALSFVSSSSIKEFVKHNVDITPYVPEELVLTITKRYKNIFTK